MNMDLAWLAGLLGFFWFFIYWVFGGVAFSLMVLLSLGRVRKVRFSCLFTLFALLDAITASHFGVAYSHRSVALCLFQATNRAQIVTAVFGCGFVGVVGSFVFGLAALVLGGLVLLFLCRRASRESDPTVGDSSSASPMSPNEPVHSSKYF